MPEQFIDQSAPSVQEGLHRHPDELPHGLIRPPERILELVAQEKARVSAEAFSPQVEQRLVNEWTLQYYFDFLGHEISYRSTPDGPEVLAVGFDEILSLRHMIGEENYRQLQTWMP